MRKSFASELHGEWYRWSTECHHSATPGNLMVPTKPPFELGRA